MLSSHCLHFDFDFLCRADDDYLVALDSTRWLARIAELLKTASDVGYSLCSNAAHVLVCYESGWDRTTQVGVATTCLLHLNYFREKPKEVVDKD